MKAGEVRGKPQRGFTFIAVLIAVAVAGIGLAVLGQTWQIASVRAREAELLFVGEQYRRAIRSYYLQPPVVGNYPRRLQDLLRDPRTPGIVRHLRQLHPDPITGSAEWGLVRAPDGGILGVYSLAQGTPLKTANFRVRDADFEGRTSYADWKFVARAAGATARGPALPLPGMQRP